jgi:uncharacterized protein (DUF4415 family)
VIVTIEDFRRDYGETKYITVGLLDLRAVILVWTPRGKSRRIISMRYANDREKKIHQAPGLITTTPRSWPTRTLPAAYGEIGEKVVSREEAQKAIKKAMRGRPPGTGRKKSTTVRFDNDILDAFKSTGKGWQSRMNAALHDWLKEHRLWCNLQKKDIQASIDYSWQIVDKETVDEIIFRTMNIRNRLILELMARGGMRAGCF